MELSRHPPTVPAYWKSTMILGSGPCHTRPTSETVKPSSAPLHWFLNAIVVARIARGLFPMITSRHRAFGTRMAPGLRQRPFP